MTTAELPASLAEIVEDFQSVPDPQRLELLLEFSDELPDLPERYDGHTEEMEQVIECQTPLFLAVELDRSGDHSADPLVQLYVAAPAEAPTSRGFASVLQQGVAGLPASTVLEVPEDLASRLGLAKALTPLRLRGMSALLGRLKRNVREQLAESTGDQA